MDFRDLMFSLKTLIFECSCFTPFLDFRDPSEGKKLKSFTLLCKQKMPDTYIELFRQITELTQKGPIFT